MGLLGPLSLHCSPGYRYHRGQWLSVEQFPRQRPNQSHLRPVKRLATQPMPRKFPQAMPHPDPTGRRGRLMPTIAGRCSNRCLVLRQLPPPVDLSDLSDS